MKKIYLYGAGGYGRAAFDAFIEHCYEDKIVAVIDNNPGLKDATIFGKPIMPYNEVRDLLDGNSTVIISVELETSITIANQLKNDGVIRYVHWAYEQDRQFDEVVHILQENNDYKIFSHSLLFELDTLKRQKEYLLDHCDPQNMKPATGTIRNRQLQLVAFANEICSIVDNISVRPFISSGNLLGYVRHNGFIPWDDDFDFSILRSEYKNMKDFLLNQFYYSKYDGPLNDDRAQLKWIKKELDAHEGETVILERPFLFRVCKKTMDGEYLLIDFFPVDEFNNAASYSDRLLMLQTYKKKLSAARTVLEFDEIIQQIDESDSKFREEGGSLLGFGFDVRESYSGSKYNGFLKKSAVFPLKKANYEGNQFWIPNKPEDFLRYEFGNNYMELPSTIGLHFSADEIKKV